MPNLLINILNYILATSYVIGTAIYGMLFFTNEQGRVRKFYKYSKFTLKSIILLHITYFLARIIDYKHAPITSIFELLTLLAFSLTLTYMYIEFKTGVFQTGFFILLIAGIFQIVSTIFIKELTEINPVLKSWLLGVHVASALIGYSAIIISGIYGFLYLMMYRHIKKNKPSNFYQKLPSLNLLETLASNAIKFGFIFLTITILIGAIWLPRAIDDFSYADPKLIMTVIIWVVYAAGYSSVKIYRIQSKTTMALALLGLIFTLFSITVVNFILRSFHRFY